jgi:hypothetical protein
MSIRTHYRRLRERGLTKTVKKYFFDEDFFTVWTPDLAWLLGVIWSDGCLFGQCIEICSKDKQLLDTIAALVSHNVGPVPKNRGNHWRLIMSSKSVATLLRSRGLHERKSLSIDMPKGMPLEFDRDFVRGLFDGDGSITSRMHRPRQRVAGCQAYICGASEALKESLINWMRANKITFNERYRGTVWRLTVSKQRSLIILYSLMYHSDSSPRLNRKFLVFNRWFVTPRYLAGGKAGVPRLSVSPSFYA